MLRGRLAAQSRKAHVNLYRFHRVWRELSLCLGFCNLKASFTILATMTVESPKFPNLRLFDGSVVLATPSHPCTSYGVKASKFSKNVPTTMGSEVFFRLGFGSQLPSFNSKGSKVKPLVWTANDLSSSVSAKIDEWAELCNVLASLNKLVLFYSQSLFNFTSLSWGFEGVVLSMAFA